MVSIGFFREIALLLLLDRAHHLLREILLFLAVGHPPTFGLAAQCVCI